ncbi:YybH family protein [Ancylomarina sp. YFZ004]
MKTPQTPSLLSEDFKAIEAQTKKHIEAVQAGDWASAMANYTEDAIVMPPNSPAIEGRANIQTFMESFPPFSNHSLEIVEIEGRGDMAYVRGTYTMTLTPEGGEAITDSGKYIEIRKKQTDGSWLLTHDIFNSDIEIAH